MRLIFFIIAFLSAIAGYSQGSTKMKKKKTHGSSEAFFKLDSIVNANKQDTLFYCGPELIKKIERITNIKATNASASFVGKIYFTLTDYNKWRNWRDKKVKD